MSTNKNKLTARGVKMMLTRARVDYSALMITDDPGVWTDVETGVRSTSVKIEGPEEARRRAWRTLFWDQRLTVAPYTGYDLWSRR